MSANASGRIPVQCPGCGKSFAAPVQSAGKQGRCPACGHGLVVPAIRPQQSLSSAAPRADNDFANFFQEAMAEKAPSGYYATPTLPAATPSPTSPAAAGSPFGGGTAAPRPRRRSRSAVDSGAMLSGIGMMVGALVWFVAGLAGGIIFFYPPILFLVGLGSFVKGLVGGSSE